jgi:hypothetical protein
MRFYEWRTRIICVYDIVAIAKKHYYKYTDTTM